MICPLQDAHQLFDMTRKGGKGLFDRLFITDISKNVLENAQAGAGGDRDLHAGLCHQNHQTDGLERNSLTTGVWSGQYDREGLLSRTTSMGTTLSAGISGWRARESCITLPG